MPGNSPGAHAGALPTGYLRPSFSVMTSLIHSLMADEKTLLRVLRHVIERFPSVVNLTASAHKPEMDASLLQWVVENCSSSRLLELMPEVSVFLDVEDLKSLSDLEGYVERSQAVLVMCTKGYFRSRNCMRELITSVRLERPLIVLLELDAARDGLSLAEFVEGLSEAEGRFEDLCFSASELRDALVKAGPGIEWNRFSSFQV